jgi:hypothetical protein
LNSLLNKSGTLAGGLPAILQATTMMMTTTTTTDNAGCMSSSEHRIVRHERHTQRH